MQIGLTAFVVALAASKSEEKSHGIDDATVRASPSRQDVAGSPHRTVPNLNSFCNGNGYTRANEEFRYVSSLLGVRRSERARAAVTMRILLVSAASLASRPR